MDPTELIANTGFEFEPLSSDLPWPLSWLDDLANRADAIGMPCRRAPALSPGSTNGCALPTPHSTSSRISPIIGWPLDDGPLAALHWRLCQHATIGHLQRHPEDWQPC